MNLDTYIRIKQAENSYHMLPIPNSIFNQKVTSGELGKALAKRVEDNKAEIANESNIMSIRNKPMQDTIDRLSGNINKNYYF